MSPTGLLRKAPAGEAIYITTHTVVVSRSHISGGISREQFATARSLLEQRYGILRSWSKTDASSRSGVADGRFFYDDMNYPRAFAHPADVPIARNISDLGAIHFHPTGQMRPTGFEYAPQVICRMHEPVLPYLRSAKTAGHINHPIG